MYSVLLAADPLEKRLRGVYVCICVCCGLVDGTLRLLGERVGVRFWLWIDLNGILVFGFRHGQDPWLLTLRSISRFAMNYSRQAGLLVLP